MQNEPSDSTAQPLTPEWLTKVLRRHSALPQGRVIDMHIATEDSYTATITRLRLDYSPDAPQSAPMQVLLKQSRHESAQSVVGAEQRQHEVDFHNRVAAQMPDASFPRCYYAAYSAETGASRLLFDDVSETHFAAPSSVPPGRPHCDRAIDALAAFHAFWWDNPALAEIASLPGAESVASDIAGMRDHFPSFADFAAERLTAPQRHVYDVVLEQLPRLLGRVTSGKHLTLIHGDANLSNILLPRDADCGKGLIIDWQLWGISFAAHDLAHLIALHWQMDRHRALERELLKRYHDQLLQHGVADYDWRACWDDNRLAVILRVLFMPMWFWTSGAPLASVWVSLERATAAFTDLDCAELLAG